MKLITVAALALAAVSFASTSASAGVVSVGGQDMILGFEINDQSGQGATTDLEIDLGAASNFISSYSVNSFSQVLGADLVATYGSNWATRSDLVWGVGGALSDGTTNTFALTSQVLLKTGSPGQLSTPFGQVASLQGGLNNQVALTSPAAAAVPTSLSNSWYGERTASGTVTTDDFNLPGFSAGGQSETASGPIGSLNLYTFTPNTPARGQQQINSTLDGTFALAGSGASATFSFNAQSAPEPSAYALGICAVLLFVVLRRRSLIA